LLLRGYGKNRHFSRFRAERRVARQEICEQALYLGVFDRTVRADEQLLEQPLVEKSSLGRKGTRVLLVTEPGHFESPLQLFVELVERLFGGGDLMFCCVYLAGDPIPSMSPSRRSRPGTATADTSSVP